MRIVSWNINGIRRIHADYARHKTGQAASFAALVASLDADILCLQELKSDRSRIDPSYVDLPGYRTFLTFPIDKKAYSGVAIYVRHPFAPLKVETALCGPSYDQFYGQDATEEASIGGYPQDISVNEARLLDREGRILVMDFGAFVLLGTYCPAGAEAEDRVAFRRLWWEALDARCRNLVAQGRQVILTGDLNVHCHPLDTVESDPDDYEPGELGPVGTCFRQLTMTDGARYGETTGRILIDSARMLHPERQGMYTCWSVRLAARIGNYGSRIDFVLLTEGLQASLVEADTMQEVQGSDHCPVFAKLDLDKLAGTVSTVTEAGEATTAVVSQQKVSSFFKKQLKTPEVIPDAQAIPATARSPITLKRKASLLQGGKKSQATLTAFLSPKTAPAVASPESAQAHVHASVPVNEDEWQTFDPEQAEQAQHVKAQFSSLFSRPVVPLCSGHSLPAKRQRTKKKGANMGREFWSCNVPLGQGQCDFWRWVR